MPGTVKAGAQNSSQVPCMAGKDPANGVIAADSQHCFSGKRAGVGVGGSQDLNPACWHGHPMQLCGAMPTAPFPGFILAMT